MIPWSATMWSALILNCVLATWFVASTGAITVSIDRSDSKPPPTRSSMIANGWRPLTKGYEETIGTNVSPSSNLERNAVQPHPVLGKLQEHMAASEKLKPQRKSKPPPPHHDYNPPSILGSFTVFGHAATKARGEAQSHNHANKHVASETREYAFLIPPPKDVYRFELDHQRKPILRDSSSYLRQPQYIQQSIHQPPDPIRAATYFIKGYTSTTNSPSSPPIPPKNRHYTNNGYPMPQMLQPPRHQAKPFESLKISNNGKPYFQPPGMAPPANFVKDKRINEHDHRSNYDRYHSHNQPHASQLISSANTGNYYTQVNHPPHHYKTTYERDPSFLVHESHEVSYVTPPSTYNGYNLRPSLPFETLLPPEVYKSSTPPPTTAASRPQSANKYQQGNDVPREREIEHEYKRPVQSTTSKQTANTAQGEILPTSGLANTYYVSEHQELTPPTSTWLVPKTKYASDINEVLPRVNPPSKFQQEVVTSNQIPQIPKIVYVRPQVPQYQSSVVPIDIRPQTSQPEYETPESISLKHFNEQQFLIQQQLIQRDRQRLAEQERQQQQEIERQQQEELKKRQEEIKQLIQQQKEEEEARLAVESVKNQSEQLAKVKDEQSPYTSQLAEYEIPKVTTEAVIVTEQIGFGEQPKILEPQVVQPDYSISKSPVSPKQQFQEQVHVQPVEQYSSYREPQTDVRPNRVQKPYREQYRRRKPTTATYEPIPTETPIQTPETSMPLTLHVEEVPVQTTISPEPTTQPTVVSSQRPRVRRPGSPLRRRRPTTTTETPVTLPIVEDFLKYDKTEENQQQLDNSRRRRIKPTQQSYEESVTERRPNIRKRPGHRNRVNPGEPYEAEIVTEIVHTSVTSSKDTEDSAQKYNENNQYITTYPSNQYFDYTSQKLLPTEDQQRESTTEAVQPEYLTEISRNKAEEYSTNEGYNHQHPTGVVTNIPLEDLFVKTEGNYFDRATVPPTTTTTTTAATTTTSLPVTHAPSVPSSTLRPHKMRPMRFGNTTRPRFSIKDYKSRLDYKSRQSTTESPVTSSSHTKQRMPTYKTQQSQAHQQQQQQQQQEQQQQQQVRDSGRETIGKYKYVSRVNYRTTSTAPSVSKEHGQSSEDGSSTTERTHRFVPKRRPINGNVYRSRISGTTSNPNRSQHRESESYTKPSTARPENVFSSSVRRRPLMKSRLPAQKETTSTKHSERKVEEATEMAAEETSFYSTMTTAASSRFTANEITGEKGESGSTTNYNSAETDGRRNEVKPSFREESQSGQTEPVIASSTLDNVMENQVTKGQASTEQISETQPDENSDNAVQKQPEVESTTNFAVAAEEEELFAKASQSVADLTSSASALYDKPGLFKAVSPESRIVSSHFKITTDEPTLPIEAFFQELSKKN